MSLRRLALGLGLAAGTLAAHAHAQSLSACADLAGMPPFGYAVAAADGTTETPAGVSVELLQEVAALRGWTLRVDLLPWARCMRDAGELRYAVVLNVVPDDAQAHHLLLSRPFYRLHGVYLYSGRTHPDGLDLKSRDALLRLRICGMSGHRYEAFGVPTANMDQGTARSFEQIVTKLHLGRCDVAIGTREEMAGLYLRNPRLSAQIADGSLRMQPLPEAPEPSLHFGVPASLPDAARLVQSLNDGLDQLEKHGAVARLIDQQLGDPGAAPP